MNKAFRSNETVNSQRDTRFADTAFVDVKRFYKNGTLNSQMGREILSSGGLVHSQQVLNDKS